MNIDSAIISQCSAGPEYSKTHSFRELCFSRTSAPVILMGYIRSMILFSAPIYTLSMLLLVGRRSEGVQTDAHGYWALSQTALLFYPGTMCMLSFIYDY